MVNKLDHRLRCQEVSKKRLINSMYGVMGNQKNFMYNLNSALTVCQYGREILQKAVDYFG